MKEVEQKYRIQKKRSARQVWHLGLFSALPPLRLSAKGNDAHADAQCRCTNASMKVDPSGNVGKRLEPVWQCCKHVRWGGVHRL